MAADPSVSPADTRELDGLRKLYGQKFNAIAKVVSILVDA